MKKKSLLNFLSKTGYKRNSPHVRRPMNLIPSGKITMKGVDFPVKGIDNLGNEQMMYPGLDYTFPGDYVLELPMMQPGRSTFNIKRVGKRKDEKNYIDSVLNANKNLDWVQRLYEKNPQSIQIPGKRGRATHYMESADNRVYPTVVRRLPNSNLEYLGNNAYDYADSTKSFIQFPSDEEAQWFAKNYKKGTAVLPKKQLAGETSSTKPYLPVMSNNGWLDEVLVTPGPNFRGEYPAFPYYNQLTSQDREFFHNDDGPIGRSVRMRAITGKVGQTYNDLRNIALRAEKFVGENTGILGAARFLNQPIKKLKGAGRTLEATILGSSPFITSPYNEEDVADFFDTMDAFGIASSAVAPLKTPLQQGIKSSGRYLARGYGNLSTGNSFIPRAWRSPIKNIDQPMSQKFFDETIDVSKLSKEDKKLWAKYQKDSGPYKIPGTKEYDEMQDLISRSSIAFPEGMPLTRMIGFENMTSPINKSGILDVSSPTSFSTGRGQEIIGNIAGEGNRRVVIPPKYAKKLEGYFGKNPYAESLDQPLDLLRQEKEVVGSGFKLKQIGKVKNELGGYDYIMKPINLSKPKQLPGSRTSNSIMRDSKGQIQFLDNETYQDALKTGILNVRDYILDPRYRNVVEANQQLANRLNMNRVLPIQKEMGNVGLYDARVAKVNQPLYIQDPRPLETKIIQGTNDGVQAQYSRNLDGSGYLTIPRLHDKAKIIKNVEHEALHHVYPNLGEGFPSFTPLETAKAKAVFKSSAELRKIEQANKIPLWYLDDVDELVPNSFDLAKDLGIKRFQMYPGKERFKQILDSYQGNKKFIKDALKLNTSRDYKRAWDMLSGVRVGYAGAAYLGYEGLQGQQSQVPQQKDGGTLPKAQLGEFFLPKSYMTFPDATYTVYADRARENQKAREYLDQKEKDYQAVKRDMTGTLEEKFRKKYGTSPHRYKYDTDPVYRVQTQQAAEEQSRLQGEIKLPHTNMFSEDYTGNPNLRFMNPNRFTGEQARFNEEFTTGVMSAMTPIPVLQSVGRLPSALKLAANTGQFLTTKTPLKDAYKINPWVFKPNSEAYYRVLGKEGLNDALESGVIRANPKNIHPFSGEPIYDRPYFSKGVPFDRDWKSPFKNKKGKQVVGSIYPDETMVEVLGHNKFHKTGDLVTSPIGVLNSFDKGINFYKRDWLRGYKEVPKPKTLPGSANSKFQSEIDWSKWNPETPKYPELIDEYNAIEESTKKAGTWMKNADGSAFKGTPEQFIQQQSSHFRKAFPNPVRERRPDFFSDEILGGQDPKNYFDENMPVQFNYHSSPNEFDFFDENLFSLGAFGKGIYTTRLPQNMYGKNQYQLYLNANNPQPYSYTRFVTKNGSEVAERVNAPKLVHEKTFYQQLEPGRDYFNPAEESSQSVVPFSNYPKSAIGNVGFFDMTNPNIYKAAAPIGIGLGTTTTQEYQKGGYITSPAPTYFGGTLPEVMVSSDDTSYPYYNKLTAEERKYFNQNSPIGRAVRSIASTGKRGETANDLREIARGVEEFGAEMTGIPGSIRFSQDPVKKLKGLGRTVEATILGSSPFITAPYNKEDVADTFDALDALGFATTTAGLAKMPLQKAANLTGRYLAQGPLKNAYRLNPVAAKQPTEVILSRVQRPGQTADLSRLDELLQRPPESLTLAERIELARINQPGYGRGFSSNPNDISYYSSPGIQSSRGYVGMPEIRSIRLPAEKAAKFNIRQNPVEGYFSGAPGREYLLPRNYVESSKTLTPQTFEELEQIRRSIDAETTALNTPHWLRGFPKSTSSESVGNIFKKKPLPDWAIEEMRYLSLPELNNPEASEVLENFLIRISTPEGKKRLKELGITNTEVFDNLKIIANKDTYGEYWLNKIALHPELPGVRNVTRHEIEHAVQDALSNSRIDKYNRDFMNLKYLFSRKKADAAYNESLKPTSDIDDILSGLELRKTPQKVDWNAIKSVDKETPPEPHRLFDYFSDKQRATNYFDSGSRGQEKSAFLAEVQQYMMDKGTIPKTSYMHITPEMVRETFIDSRFDQENLGKFLRLFNIMKPTENNYELISKGLNKMLSLAPYAVPAVMSVKELQETPQYQKGGQQVGTDILDKYKRYIMGDYKPEEEKDLKNTYDKLNRNYYKKAKESGMTAPNYIMSML